MAAKTESFHLAGVAGDEGADRTRECRLLPLVKVKENESFEQALRRFKKQVEKAGILTELRRRESYDKPSVRRKKKAAASRKRAIKKLKKMAR